MVQAIRSFLDFCYLARRSFHTTATLQQMESALVQFHTLRSVFQELGVRPDGFSLPRQHSLVHYTSSIRLFGSPNGLCSSITESRHITAVKRPWRRSSRHNALEQILRTNTRLSKLAAARIEFERRGMLNGNVLTASRISARIEDEEVLAGPPSLIHLPAPEVVMSINDTSDSGYYDGPAVSSFFELAHRAGVCTVRPICYPYSRAF
jgi:hypothetical protein